MNVCKILLLSVAFCTATAAATVIADPQQRPGQADPSKPAAGHPMPQLTPEHGMLKKMVGTWDATITTTMPGKAPVTSRATAEYVAIGDTWVASTFKSEIEGRPYVGHGIDGYDTLKNKHVSVWADSWSTEMHQFEGSRDQASNSVTVTGECHDPETGKVIREKLVTEMQGDDAMTMRMFMSGPDGKDAEGMKIEYKRRK